MGELAKTQSGEIVIKDDLHARKAASDLSKTAYKAGRITFDEAFELVVKYMELLLQIGREYKDIDYGKPGPKDASDASDVITSKQKLIEDIGFSPGYIKQLAYLSSFTEEFEDYKQECYDKKTWPGFMEFLRVIRKLFKEVKEETPPLPEGKFDVIVIDPPWPMEKILRDVRPNQIVFDYHSLNESELSELEIPCADNCHIWLWTTHKFIPMAFRLLEKWGLKYVCTFVWHKPGGFQPVGLPQYNCEFALYARKGSPIFIDTKDFPVCFTAPRGSHSEKPEEFYAVLRRTTSGQRLDMYNRRKIEGFTGWGKGAVDE